MNIIEMREKRTKLLATMDGFLETHRDGKGILSAEDDATYSGMEKELAALTNEIKRMERREAIDADLSKPVSTPITGKPMTATAPAQTKTGRAADEYNSSFWNVMRSKAPMPQVVNALQVGDDAEGGYLLSGVMALYHQVPFREVIDRAYGAYDSLKVKAMSTKVLEEYKKFLNYRVGKGELKASQFELGAVNQFALKHNAAGYPNFRIENVCANCSLWQNGQSVDIYAQKGAAKGAPKAPAGFTPDKLLKPAQIKEFL